MVPAKKENLIRVKTDLAKKYESLAAQANGKPKRRSFLNKAKLYRQQVALLERL